MCYQKGTEDTCLTQKPGHLAEVEWRISKWPGAETESETTNQSIAAFSISFKQVDQEYGTSTYYCPIKYF